MNRTSKPSIRSRRSTEVQFRHVILLRRNIRDVFCVDQAVLLFSLNLTSAHHPAGPSDRYETSALTLFFGPYDYVLFKNERFRLLSNELHNLVVHVV